VPNVVELLAQVTGRPSTTDADVARSHGAPVDALRRALRLLAFMGFAELTERNNAGWFWEARQPSPTSPRVQALRAEAAKTLDDFLASRIFLDLEGEMKAYESATSPDAPRS